LNIIDLISDDGIALAKKSSSNGGEYSGPCPWCGGEDRFSVFPGRSHYVCRQCKKAGDSIQYLKDYRQKTYYEACSVLGINPRTQFNSLDPAKHDKYSEKIRWEPREIQIPSEKWQNKAESFLYAAFKVLMGKGGIGICDYLETRGIRRETIVQGRMGYNKSAMYYDSKIWGIDEDRKVWIPEGILIPQFFNGRLIHITIRQSDPTADNRFISVLGSAMGYFDYQSHCFPDMAKSLKKPWIITESKLDGWLLHQEYGAKVNVFAMGGVTARPDTNTIETIRDHHGLLNVDNDTAGRAELGWWKKHFPCSQPLLSTHKDPGEDYQAGLSIKNWIKAGIDNLHGISTGQTTAKPARFIPDMAAFKNKIIQQYKNTIGEKPKRKQPVKPVKKVNVDYMCVNGRLCASMKDRVCYVDQSKPFETMVCPNDVWYAWQDEGSSIIEIIQGVKQKRKFSKY